MYVADAYFGAGTTIFDFYERLYRNFSATDNYLEAKQWMLEEYESTYGVTSHNKPTVGLGAMAVNPKEDPRTNGLLDNHFRKYLESDMYGKTGISFTELLNKPRHEVARLFELIDEFDMKRYLIEEKATEKAKSESNRSRGASKDSKKNDVNMASLANTLMDTL